MALQFIFGAAGSGKSHFLCETMLHSIYKDNTKNFIYLVPEQFTLETQKKMVYMQQNLYGRSGVMNVDILSFNRLAFRVFEELGIDGLKILDDTGKTLILRKVIENNKSSLKIFQNKSNMGGFIEEIKSAISELYQYGINADDLGDIIGKIEGHEMTKTKLGDLMLIYDAFRKYILDMTDGNVKYITKEEVLEELCKQIPISNIIKCSEIVLDGFTGFTPIQYRLISLLMEYGVDVKVALTLPVEQARKMNITGFEQVREQELFKMSKDTVNQLVAYANDRRICIKESVLIDNSQVGRHKDNPEIAFIERNIFRNKADVYTKKQENIRVYKTVTPASEGRIVTEIISNMMHEDSNLRFRDFAVISGDDNCIKAVDMQMTLAEMPHFVDSKRSITRNPFITTVMGALDIIVNNYSYDSVFKFLRCYMTDLTREEIDALDNYVLALGIKSKRRYAKEFTKLYRGQNEENLAICNVARQKFIGPIFRLEEDIKNKTIREVTTALFYYIRQMDLKKKLEEYARDFENKNMPSLKLEYSQVYKLTMELFDKLVMILGDETVSLSEYCKLLEAGFEEIKVGLIPLIVDQIIIGDIERTRLSEIKVLFIMGVNDGIIPKHGARSGLLSQNDRLLLNNLDINLSPTTREASFEQKFYLYLSLTKPSSKIFLSYSERSVDGSALRPSYLISNMIDLFTKDVIGNTKKLEKLENMSNEISVFNMLATRLTDFGSEKFDKSLKKLLDYYSVNPKFKKKLKKAISGAFFINTEKTLDSEVAKVLYSDATVFSATRLEKYAACAYAHFINYGLALAERQVYELQATDVGNIYHKSIELFTKRLGKDINIDTLKDDERKAIVKECLEKVAEEYSNDIMFSTGRNRFLMHKCEKVADKAAWAIVEHLRRGGFSPKEFELSTESGRIDRVDTLDLDGTIFVKIIDYKSGNTKFDISETVNGLKIQLMFYMDSVIKREKQAHPGKRVEPGAVFYFNIKDPILDYDISYENDEIYNEKMLEQFSMTGFVNSRSEVIENIDKTLENGKNKKSHVADINLKNVNSALQLSKSSGVGSCINFQHIIDVVKKKSEEFSKEIVEGNIDIKPFKFNGKTPCEYCKYKSICNFNTREFGNRFNRFPGSSREELNQLAKTLNQEITLSESEESEDGNEEE